MDQEDKYCLFCCEEIGRPVGCEVCGPEAKGMDFVNLAHQLPPGTMLADRYLVGRVLGQGTCSITYLGVDIRQGIRVAIKEYFPSSAASRKQDKLAVVPLPGEGAGYHYGLELFLEQSIALSKLGKYPHLVKMFDSFRAYGTGYQVMKYIKGIPLDAFIEQKGGKLSQEEAISIISMVLGGLSAAHKKDLFHLDVNPRNIIIDEDGAASIVDFGSTKFAMSLRYPILADFINKDTAPLESYLNTATPEGPWTDVYGAGATLMYMMTGYYGPSAPERVGGKRYKSIAEIAGAVGPHPVSEIAAKAMELNPEDRYQNAEQMLDALLSDETQTVAEAETPPVESETPGAIGRKSRYRDQEPLPSIPRAKEVWVFLSIVAIAVVAALVLMLASLFTGEGIIDLSGKDGTKAGSVNADPARSSDGKQTAKRPIRVGLPLDMAYIPASYFQMGSPPDELGRGSDEWLHWVRITKPFMMSVAEVTNKQYLKFAEVTRSHHPQWFDPKKKKFADRYEQFYQKGKALQAPNRPVVGVSWYDAIAFANYLSEQEHLTKCYEGQGPVVIWNRECTGYRLPTEAEWEYAARVGSRMAFTNGPISQQGCGVEPYLDRVGWYCGNSKGVTRPIARKESNDWGLYDMHGNVREWIWDWYSPDYEIGFPSDPTGPEQGLDRVIRGCSISSLARDCRAAKREAHWPGFRQNDLGFRLVRAVKQ